jgi:hypothetical protein
MPPSNDPSPRARTSSTVRLIGTVAVVAFVIAIILLALGVFNFEQSGWFQ